MSQKTLLSREDVDLSTELTTEQLAAKGRELASILDEIKAEEDAQASERHEAKARMSEISARLDAARAIVSSGRETRKVTVENWAHHDEGKVYSTRLDMDKVFHERAMTDEERQLPIDFVAPPPAAPEE